MALSIKNKETEALARELARLTKKPITEAVHDVLVRGLERERNIQRLARPDNNKIMEDVRLIQERVARLPILDHRSDDEILGYNENGVFDR